MPNAAKGARLYLRSASRTRKAVWLIRAGTKVESTGCPADERGLAEQKLADYIAAKHKPNRQDQRCPAEIEIADVLSLYLDERAGKVARPSELAQRVRALAFYFGARRLSAINGALCRAYVADRGSVSLARRELEDLRAAINFHRREGLCSEVVEVVLPEKSQSRERWLTRDEAARLLWVAMGWSLKPGTDSRGRPALVLDARDRQNTLKRRHVARFTLVGLYSGTRSTAICQAAMHPTPGRGYADLERGVFYRRGEGVRETKKRQPPIRLHPKLLDHLRRWHATGHIRSAIVKWKGGPITRMNQAFRNTAEAAGLDDVTPHILRHTAITWAMQNGAERWEVAGMFGLTMEMIETVHGHHDPNHGSAVHAALNRKRA